MVVYSFVETAEMRVRRCEPYLFVYTTRCKARWIGREALEVFVTEFGMNPPEYYEAALTDGRITINKRLVGCSHVFRNGDVVDHRAHRHEPPVDAGPIAIVANDAHVLALDKPASMPMHPCGAYHHNSLTGILAEDFSENGFRAARAELKMVHRLDRLTSGLVLFAKSQEVARDLCERIRDGGARKTYLARVLGNFPHNAPKHLQDTCADPTAKPCVTRMRLLRRLEDGTSIVECTPLTGRTHQIRLHLLWMGHAIANDGCYGGDRITNFPKGIAPATTESSHAAEDAPRLPGEGDDALVRRKCTRCRAQLDAAGDGADHSRCIWLHALRYAAVDGSWSYETELPKWATAPAAAAPQAKPSSCALC
ncbi:pseudouridine synthase [Pelagophyceae sp. CCMP2097]|nr:pseudouridine synthase [Pelagophyceae sp. CCMP2097]